MAQWIMANESWLRLLSFVSVLVVMALWEQLSPRRPRIARRGPRWATHLVLVAINTALVRVLLPGTAIGVAVLAEGAGWGLFHHYDMPYWLSLIIGVIALDFVIYLQHVMFHAVPGFWRLHRVHHADLDFDVTTGIRFHPIEIFLSMLIKFASIVALGAPAAAVRDTGNLKYVQSRQRQPAALCRSLAAAAGRDARHASRSSLGVATRDEQQFRIQSAVVGSFARHLSRSTRGRARRDDNWP